jgi:hypothetical protein
MSKRAFARQGALAAACVFAVASVQAAACGGSSVDAKGGEDSGSTTVPGNDAASGGGEDSSTAPPPQGDGSTGPSSGHEGGALKTIGSPCSVGTDCTSGTCDTSIPNGMCTKACTADSDCTEKGNSTGAVCISAMCFELCKVVDAGATPAEDGGKTTAPCKNKALICEAVPGQPAPLCMPNPDGGGSEEDSGSEDSGSVPDAAIPADAAGTD